MKKKSFSLQKLPELAKQKKDRIVQKCNQFDERMKVIERL